MPSATDKLEGLEFTFWTRVSYFVCAIGGLAIVIREVLAGLQAGEINVVSTAAGLLAMGFSAVVYRRRVRQVMPLLRDALVEEGDGALAESELKKLPLKALARRFVLWGRKSMQGRLTLELRALASGSNKPTMD